jgi:hypothetical protein
VKRTISAWFILVALAAAFTWVFHRNQIRGENQAAALQREERLAGERARLLRERVALEARQASAADIRGLVADGAEARAIRTQIADLEQKAARAAAAPPDPFGESTTVPSGSWAYAGRSSPRTALMSVLWTASHGDVDRLTDLIEFSGPTRAEAEAMFAQLPLGSQQEYGSPERVVATLLAGNFPKDASAATYNGGAGYAEKAYASLTIDHSAGETRTNVYSLDLTDSGWRLQVPSEVLAGYQKILQGGAATGGASSAP